MTIEMEDVQIRQQFDIEYSELRSQFINISKPHLTANHLNSLKIEYSNVINSARTSDYIGTSIERLLRTLEKRGALSYNNIKILKDISETYVRDNILERLLRNYEGQSRPSLPAHNRYLMQSGKYTKERPTKIKFISSNESIILGVNENENESINRVLEMPSTNGTSSEDLTFPETETLVENNVPTLFVERRNVNDCSIYFEKIRHKIHSRYCIGALGAFIGATLLIASIFMSNKLSVESPASAPRFEAQPGTSGRQTVFNSASQPHRQPIQVTLYTTQPAFQITLPGSIDVGPTNQSPTNNESEVMRRVLQEISGKLGRHWRDVARYLRVTEYEIDEIEGQLNLSLSEKALKALLKFESKCDPLQWKPKLKQALDKARRRDLMEMVDELSSRKY